MIAVGRHYSLRVVQLVPRMFRAFFMRNCHLPIWDATCWMSSADYISTALCDDGVAQLPSANCAGCFFTGKQDASECLVVCSRDWITGEHMLFEQNYNHANKTIRNRTVHLNFHQHRFGSNVASIITIFHFCSHAWSRIWHFCVSHCVALHCAVQFIHISFHSRVVACRATLHLCVFKAYVVCIT